MSRRTDGFELASFLFYAIKKAPDALSATARSRRELFRNVDRQASVPALIDSGGSRNPARTHQKVVENE
jgi:hypothetical protein